MHSSNYKTASNRQTGTYLHIRSWRHSKERYWTTSSSALGMWLWTKTSGLSQTRNPGWPARSAHSSGPATLPSGQATELLRACIFNLSLHSYPCQKTRKDSATAYTQWPHWIHLPKTNPQVHQAVSVDTKPYLTNQAWTRPSEFRCWEGFWLSKLACLNEILERFGFHKKLHREPYIANHQIRLKKRHL